VTLKSSSQFVWIQSFLVERNHFFYKPPSTHHFYDLVAKPAFLSQLSPDPHNMKNNLCWMQLVDLVVDWMEQGC
jgi:hypothetical protein